LVSGDGGGFGFLRVLRLARVFRVFKMGKYNKGMQLVSRVMMQSAPALQLMMFFTILGMILFGSMLYFCESGKWHLTEEYPDGVYLREDATGMLKEPSPFTSIPACFWWVIVTQTTVGYGDTYPTTGPGKMVGTITMLSGVLVLALPITIIGANFANEYAKSLEQEACDRADEEAKTLEQQRKVDKQEEAERLEIEQLEKDARDEASQGIKGEATRRLTEHKKSKKEALHRSQSRTRAGSSFSLFGRKNSTAVTPNDEGGAGALGVDSSGVLQKIGLAAKTPVPPAYHTGNDEEDIREKEQQEAYEISKAAALKLSTTTMLMVRDMIDDSKMPRVPGTEVIRELEEGQQAITEGLPISKEFVTRQLGMILMWIERAETESSLNMTQRDANKLRKCYLEMAASCCGAVADGSPATS